jgi:hypothetical protein
VSLIKVCSVGSMCFGVGLRELFANASDAVAAAGLRFQAPPRHLWLCILVPEVGKKGSIFDAV